MVPRKCGAFLADGSGEYDMSLWSVLTNTHKPPGEGDACANIIRRGNRLRKRVVVEEISDVIGPRVKPSMLTRLHRLVSFGFWSGPSKPRETVPVAMPLELPPPPPRQRTATPHVPAGPSVLKTLTKFIFKKQNLILKLPLLFLIPVATFFVMRGVYKQFIRRHKKRYRTKIRYLFIAVIFCSFFFAVHKVLVTLYEIAFVD